MKSYGERTLDSIAVQCERRGIPGPEIESVHAFLGEKLGKKIREMNMPELNRLNRELPYLMEEYLEGEKRRGGGPPGAWEGGTVVGGAGADIE